ncbi:MAG: hypothetical protein LKI34_10400 [Bifidobacterium tibiigranuli]|jgi:hypothetical protein|uniref:hypothetical protein n=1 Tax=Bifidobacterium tibiigranuli TaxID=2172043 RepID=UPI0026EF0018|nr:hypothetical protein [Bifidobacterium tibiigranuli]MCI1674610.1 hypothetical protein [Bifidobacterium tibiigranuli]MCI1714162.1 hypothetical protein [Bifidobacterium tibiigranuli]MCI1834129.1 hypothetical protein [Bifidobacterium tibiigranuli]
MSDITRTQAERDEIRDWSNALADQAEAGMLTPIPGSSVYAEEDAPAMTDNDLLAIFAGRPRQELRQTAKKTWRIRTTEQLDAWATAGAKEEHINMSALIRKAVAEYLGNHHKTAQSA